MSEIPYSVRGGRSTTSVDGLTDTNITNLQNQQILKYDSASQKWVNAVDGGGDATISSLGDTLISNPQTNQSLVYNATVSPARWENQPTPFTQSDFTNTVSTDAAFIKHKPIITTTSLATMVGISTGINKEGDLTAFGKGAGYAGKNGHICIGELSGNLGSTRAISLGYNTHATHVNSVVIHGGVGLSSSATNAFYIDPLRTLDALTETAGDMKINMYNTSTKEIFLTNNLLVPGNTKLNGTLEVSNGIGAVNQVLTSNNTGALTWTDKSQLSADIYDLGGLTWSGVSDNELIRRVDATNADGAGMKLIDTSFPTVPQTTYYKDVSYFGRHGLLTIPFGLNRYESSFAGHNQRLIPYSPILSTGQISGLYLNHIPSVNNYNVNVGIGVVYPTKALEVGTTLYVDDVNRRVGIGIANPEEDFEVDGSIQIDSNNVARLKFQQSGQNPHALGEIDGEQDGTDGGDLQLFTKVDGGSVTEKLRINNVGAIGLLGANYGSSGQFLKSNGSGSAVSWDTPIDTTYTAGSNMSLVGTEFNIPQSVATSASPTFTALTLGSAGNAIINLTDITDLGADTVAQMKGLVDGNNGGKIEFYTKKLDGGSLTKRMNILNDGTTELLTDTGVLQIFTEDGTSQQGYFYNSITGTKDLSIDSYSGVTNKGIRFQTQGVQRMRIGHLGELGFGAGNSVGTSGQLLQSNGNASPSWVDAPSGGNTVETYINRKTLSGTGATDFFNINRDIQRSFVVDLRIVGGDGANIITLYHTRTGVVFTASEIFIRNTEVLANTSFSGGGSAYTTSIIEAPSNTQLDIRVNSGTGSTQTVSAYMTLYGTRTNPSVIIS